MQIVRSINALRRAFTRKVTRPLGVTRVNKNGQQVIIQKILVCRLNHRLGNLLLLTPLLQEIKQTFPDADVDLFVKGPLAPTLFKNYDNINTIIQLPKKAQKEILKYLQGWLTIRRNHYDLVVNAIHSSSSGKVSTQFANGRFRFLGDIDEEVMQRHPDYRHMAKLPVYSFRRAMRMLGLKPSHEVVPPLDLKLSDTEIHEGRRLMRELLKNDRRTLCIYTYATGQKCYTSTWWNALFNLLKESFPDDNILEILPVENVSQISFKAPSFYSKDLRQIGSLIANSCIFIGADSGMMHLASASGVPVIGLFKAQNINQYAPYNSKSLGIRTDHVSVEEIARIVENLIAPVPSPTRS